MWPFSKRESEKRESAPFTDSVAGALFAQASGTTTGDPSALGALEAAAGLYAAAAAAARVTPANEITAALTPACRALIFRDCIRRGESVHRLIAEGGAVRLLPAGSWDVRGAPDERSWWYRLDQFGPSGNSTHLVPSAAVVHVRYATDAARPWHGISPLGWARATGALAAALESRLAEESAGPVGHVLAVPADGGDGEADDSLVQLKSDLAGARGKTVLAETVMSGWGEGRTAAPQHDFRPQRFGANPPATLPVLRSDAALAVLAACQVPGALFDHSDGTAQREAWRRWAMGPLAGLAAIVEAELSAKLDQPVRFDFSGLWAHDIQGRAASFAKLVAGGMPLDRAAAVSGVLSAEEG